MKARDFWVRPENPDDNDDVGICFETKPYPNLIGGYIHVREVLPDTVTISLADLNTIRELVGKCYMGAALARIDIALATSTATTGDEK